MFDLNHPEGYYRKVLVPHKQRKVDNFIMRSVHQLKSGIAGAPRAGGEIEEEAEAGDRAGAVAMPKAGNKKGKGKGTEKPPGAHVASEGMLLGRGLSPKEQRLSATHAPTPPAGGCKVLGFQLPLGMLPPALQLRP